MGRMRGHAERNDVVLLAVFIEFCINMALMPIKHQHAPCTLPPPPAVFVKVLEPFKACLIICPSVFCRFHDPVGRDVAVAIPRGEVVAALHTQKWGQDIAIYSNTTNCYSLFSITRLNSFWFPYLIRLYNNHSWLNLAHHKASLIKVIGIFILDPIFSLHVIYKVKPRANYLWIFV